MTRPPTSYPLIRKVGAAIWHVERSDRHTVCGRLPEGVCETSTTVAEKGARVCSSCYRMRDADTVQLATRSA